MTVTCVTLSPSTPFPWKQGFDRCTGFHGSVSAIPCCTHTRYDALLIRSNWKFIHSVYYLLTQKYIAFWACVVSAFVRIEVRGWILQLYGGGLSRVCACTSVTIDFMIKLVVGILAFLSICVYTRVMRPVSSTVSYPREHHGNNLGGTKMFNSH